MTPPITQEDAVERLADLSWKLGRTPVLTDLEGLWAGEAPSRAWFYRSYPGGWQQAVLDATGLRAQQPGHPRDGNRSAGGPGFRCPANQRAAQEARTTNDDFNPFGELVSSN